MEKHMNFKSNSFWSVVRKCYVLDIAVLFVCRVSLWRKGVAELPNPLPFFSLSMTLGRLGPTSHYAGEGSQPVFLFPAPLTAGAETQVWSHCQSQEMAACLEWWKKCAGTFKSSSLDLSWSWAFSGNVLTGLIPGCGHHLWGSMSCYLPIFWPRLSIRFVTCVRAGIHSIVFTC